MNKSGAQKDCVNQGYVCQSEQESYALLSFSVCHTSSLKACSLFLPSLSLILFSASVVLFSPIQMKSLAAYLGFKGMDKYIHACMHAHLHGHDFMLMCISGILQHNLQ